MNEKEEQKYLKRLKPIRDYNEKAELRKELIKMIAMGGFAAACLVAPGLAYTAKLFPNPDGYENKKLRQQLGRLVSGGYIQKRGGKYYLTAKGILERNKIAIAEFVLPPQPKELWDKKWHIVMFDIPESHKAARDSFRRTLLRLGYRTVQKSVYVCPYDYSKEIHDLAKLHDVDIDIFTAEVSKISREQELRKLFKIIKSK